MEADRLRAVFQEIDLPEIEGIDFRKMTPQEIAQVLPPYGGKHPMKGILIDTATGKAYGVASGWDAETVAHNGMSFQAGAVSPELAARAGGSWPQLGNHMEPVAAAFMRKNGIMGAVLYINGRNPCWGTAEVPGCYYRMSEFLAENSTLSVYNKWGADFISSWPDRRFHFTGAAD